MAHPSTRRRAVLIVPLVAGLALLRQPDAGAAASLAPPRMPPAAAATETAVFGAGCFWSTQSVFRHVRGVTDAVAGYAGGTEATATYEQVSAGRTAHAEAVRVTFDPSKVTYAQLLQVFFTVAHDPTQLDRQGPDVGKHYRSVIFYESAAQRRAAEAAIAELRRAKAFPRPIVTQVVPFDAFYRAEEHHQDYDVTHPTDPYVVANDLPKIRALRDRLPALYRESRVQ